MEKKETLMIFELMSDAYPFSFKTLSEEQRRRQATLWFEAFQNVPYEIVDRAVRSIILYDNREFAPHIATVTNRILDMFTSDPESAALDAWDRVRKFVRDYPQDEYRLHFNELPEPVRSIYRVPDLISIANNSAEQNQNFEKPRFLKSYKEIKRAQEVKAISTGNWTQIADPERIKRIE